MSDTKKIREELKLYVEKNKRQKLGHSWFSCNYWCLAKIAADKASIPGFIDRLVVFIKQKQAIAKGIDNVGDKWYKKADLS